jgi:hypothetical protein
MIMNETEVTLRDQSKADIMAQDIGYKAGLLFSDFRIVTLENNTEYTSKDFS